MKTANHLVGGAVVVALLGTLLGGLGGCAGGSGSSTAKASEDSEELSTAEVAAAAALAESREPITSESVSLWVHGLSCPLCSTNVESVLKKVTGVKQVQVDLEKGIVRVGLEGPVRPSRRDMWKAIDSAGFTLVKVETN